jgi:hypothetical protein
MKYALKIGLIAICAGVIGCNQSPEEAEETGQQVTTGDINQSSHFFSFTVGDFVPTYDLKFMAGNMTYLVVLNSAAGVVAAVDTGGDFQNAVLPLMGYQPDSGSYVIGDRWMDISTYNPADHSIQTNGTVFFLRSADYEWVKFMVLSATPSLFTLQYAHSTADSTFTDPIVVEVPYAADTPAYYDFSTATTVTPEPWHLGLVTIAVYSPDVGSIFYMPTVLLNYEEGVQVAILKDQDYESVTAVPGEVTWLTDTGPVRHLGYNQPEAVLVYHPEPPYNHKVIVENPDYVYLLKVGEQTYKLRFLDYSAGVVLFEYDSL